MTTLRLTYYPDITQGVPDADVRDAVVVFAQALGAQLSADLGREIQVDVPEVMSVPAQYDDLLAGHSQIALMKPVAYVFAHHEQPSIVPVCVAHRPIDGAVGTFYFTQVYARRDTGLTSLADLAARQPGTLRMAFGDRFSTSNFLIPAGLMRREAGIHPFLFFKSVNFTGGHDRAAQAVYDGEADVGAGHDGVIKILAATHPDAAEQLVQLGREDIHSDPVVVHEGSLPEGISSKHIQDACVAITSQQAVLDALDLFWGWVKGLSPTEHANYRSIEDALERLHLSAADMLSA